MINSFSILIGLGLYISVSVLDFYKYLKLDLEKGISIALKDLSGSINNSFAYYAEEDLISSKVLEKSPKPSLPLTPLLLEGQKGSSPEILESLSKGNKVSSEVKPALEARKGFFEKNKQSALQSASVAYLFSDPLFGIGGPFWFPGSQMEAVRILDSLLPSYLKKPGLFGDVADFLSNVEAFSFAGSYVYNLVVISTLEDDVTESSIEDDPTLQDIIADFNLRFAKTHSWSLLELSLSATYKLLCSEGSPIIGKKLDDCFFLETPRNLRDRDFFSDKVALRLSGTQSLVETYWDLKFKSLNEVQDVGIKKTHAIKGWSIVLPFLFPDLGPADNNFVAEFYALLKRNPFLDDPQSFAAFKSAIALELNKDKPFVFTRLRYNSPMQNLNKSTSVKDCASPSVFYGIGLLLSLLNIPLEETLYVLTYGTWETCTLLVEKTCFTQQTKEVIVV